MRAFLYPVFKSLCSSSIALTAVACAAGAGQSGEKTTPDAARPSFRLGASMDAVAAQCPSVGLSADTFGRLDEFVYGGVASLSSAATPADPNARQIVVAFDDAVGGADDTRADLRFRGAVVIGVREATTAPTTPVATDVPPGSTGPADVPAPVVTPPADAASAPPASNDAFQFRLPGSADPVAPPPADPGSPSPAPSTTVPDPTAPAATPPTMGATVPASDASATAAPASSTTPSQQAAIFGRNASLTYGGHLAVALQKMAVFPVAAQTLEFIEADDALVSKYGLKGGDFLVILAAASDCEAATKFAERTRQVEFIQRAALAINAGTVDVTSEEALELEFFVATYEAQCAATSSPAAAAASGGGTAGAPAAPTQVIDPCAPSSLRQAPAGSAFAISGVTVQVEVYAQDPRVLSTAPQVSRLEPQLTTENGLAGFAIRAPKGKFIKLIVEAPGFEVLGADLLSAPQELVLEPNLIFNIPMMQAAGATGAATPPPVNNGSTLPPVPGSAGAGSAAASGIAADPFGVNDSTLPAISDQSLGQGGASEAPRTSDVTDTAASSGGGCQTGGTSMPAPYLALLCAALWMQRRRFRVAAVRA